MSVCAVCVCVVREAGRALDRGLAWKDAKDAKQTSSLPPAFLPSFTPWDHHLPTPPPPPTNPAVRIPTSFFVPFEKLPVAHL